MISVHKIVPNFLFSSGLFLFAFFLAWQISAYSNFLYSTWYEVLDLEQTILKYAPENKYKHGFENTDKKQHVKLFSGIVDAIQHDGSGLEKLRYKDSKVNKSETLLTEAEIVHLQDVANLVNFSSNNFCFDEQQEYSCFKFQSSFVWWFGIGVTCIDYRIFGWSYKNILPWT